jgi:osmotically-inducible protein OsmY
MSSPPITVPEDATLAELAALLDSRGIKRAPVIKDNRMVGIVSRSNVLGALASHLGQAPAAGRSDDHQIQEALYAELSRQSWAPSAARCSVVVQDGVVHLWGYLEDPVQRQAVIVAAENIRGVTQVVDHTLRSVPYGV